MAFLDGSSFYIHIFGSESFILVEDETYYA